MIHRQTFKNIYQQLIDQPEHTPELLSTLLNLNQSELPTVINFNTASADAMNDLWWLQRLANRNSLPTDNVDQATIGRHLRRVESEYWLQLQKLCRNSGFLSLEAFDQVLTARSQEINQHDTDDPQGMQPFYGFWHQFGEAIGAIMDNDRHYYFLDQFFKFQPDVNNTTIDNTLVNQILTEFNALKFNYVAKVMYLNNNYGNDRVPRINFDNYRQRLEFVHEEFKETLIDFFRLAGRLVNESINETNGSEPDQVTNVESLVDISNGLIPIDSDDARAFKSVLLGFENLHREFLFQQIQRLEQATFLSANDFQAVLDYWASCQTTEERSDLTVFYDFFQHHREQLMFLTIDFAAFKFVNEFLHRHENDYQQVRIADALELHDHFMIMRSLYLATVDVIKKL